MLLYLPLLVFYDRNILEKIASFFADHFKTMFEDDWADFLL